MHNFIANRLINNGHEAYFVGGYVRDIVIGRNSNDVDVVTSARPDDITNLFKDQKVSLVGKSFGVIIVNGIEIATFRYDNYNANSVLENVTFANTLKEDISRRDLTINSLAIDINGNVIDYFNGVSDINKGIIRFVGNPIDRINEDPCRILRACRFVCLFQNGKFHPDTYSALLENSHLVKSIPPERIRLEIKKALKHKNASRFFESLYSINALQYVFPTLNNCIGVTQNVHHSEPVFFHCMNTGDKISCKYPLVKLAGYLHDIGKPMSKNFNPEKQDYEFLDHHVIGNDLVINELKRLRFTNYEIDFISGLVRYHMSNVTSKRTARRLLSKVETISHKDLLRLQLADKFSKYPIRENFSLAALKEKAGYFDLSEPFSIKDLDINGNDIIEKLNIKPGPVVGKILKHLFEIVLDNPELNNHNFLIKETEAYYGNL